MTAQQRCAVVRLPGYRCATAGWPERLPSMAAELEGVVIPSVEQSH